MKKIFFASLMSMAFLSACGGGSSSNNSNPPIVSVDANGNCSKVFLQDYNGVVMAKKAFTQSPSSINVKDIKSSCDVFRSHHAETVTCTAANTLSGSAVTVQASDHYVYCDSIDRIISGKGDVIPLIPESGTNCSEQFKNDYNAVMTAMNYAMVHSESSDVSALKNKCDDFRKRNNKNDKCDAQVVRAGVNYPFQPQGSVVFTACSQIDDLINKKAKLEAP